MQYIKSLCTISLLSILSGCGAAVATHELTPVGQRLLLPDNCLPPTEIYRQGEVSRVPVYRVALVAAHGNGYANQDDLEQALLIEAGKVCADGVILTGKEISKDETVGAYGGGVMVSEQIMRPHLYGIAVKEAKTVLGIQLKEGFIDYVYAGSTAEKNGLKEGMKVLTINGIYVPNNPYVIEQEVLTKNAGDKIRIEIMSKEGNKSAKEITLERFEAPKETEQERAVKLEKARRAAAQKAAQEAMDNAYQVTH